jgi:hypothetical protein
MPAGDDSEIFHPAQSRNRVAHAGVPAGHFTPALVDMVDKSFRERSQCEWNRQRPQVEIDQIRVTSKSEVEI